MAGLRGKALVAYLLVCTVWGSTYLAIRIGVQAPAAVLFAGVRFLVAGLLLGRPSSLALGIGSPAARGTGGMLAITGVFLLLGGNAIVVWSEQFVASGMASVFVAAMPLWAAFFDAIDPGRQDRAHLADRRRARARLPRQRAPRGHHAARAATAPTSRARSPSRSGARPGRSAASTGSGTRPSVARTRRPPSQMLAGGLRICAVGPRARRGGPATGIREPGLGAMAYLVVFGSIVGYTAFGYALEHASATVVGTYAYVNPVVAVLLGWLVLHEPITGRTSAAMALILGAVLWIQLAPGAHGEGRGLRARAAAAPGGRMTAPGATDRPWTPPRKWRSWSRGSRTARCRRRSGPTGPT